MIHKFTDVLVQKLHEVAANYEKDILEGRCATFDEYKYNSGVLRGLAGAVEIAKDLANLTEEDDD